MRGCNVEIKAKVKNMDHVQSAAARIADSGPMVITQEDVFFNCDRGRLKLRKYSDSAGELIYYDRENHTIPAVCNYMIHQTADPGAIENILAESLGIRGVVRKERRLYLVGQTRIHIDRVAGLGHYVELEVVLSPHQTIREGRDVAKSIMQQLEISDNELIDCAYIDLMRE
jgi:predicted adenylyl cyclase CyaB